MRYYLLPIISLLSVPVFAQSVVDATRYGSSNIAGTARYRAMGGAFGALGGDPTAMSDNPAGMGIYRGTNELSFTPNLTFAHCNMDGGVSTDNKKADVSISNFSGVFSFRTNGDYLVNFNIGIGFNHREGVRRKYQSIVSNPLSSFGQYLNNRANNCLMERGDFYNPHYLATDDATYNNRIPLTVLYAWDTKTILPVMDGVDGDGNQLYAGVTSYDLANGYSSYQRLFVNESNRTDEYNINASANWNDALYAGLTLTIFDINSTIMTEIDEDYDSPLESYTQYFNNLESKGSGFGIKAGLLYKPTDVWRIGAAAHTPTWYKMEDIYNGKMQNEDQNVPAAGGQSYNYKYRYFSPWQLQLSSAWVIARRALIGVEWDMQDFTTQKLKRDNEQWDDGTGAFSTMNEMFKKYNRVQQTYKVGAEFRATDHFSLRAGYAFKTSPFTANLYDNPGVSRGRRDGSYVDENTLLFDSSTKPNYSLLGSQRYYTGGFGWAGEWWHIDLAFMDRVMEEKVALFPTTDADRFDDHGNEIFTDDPFSDGWGAVTATHTNLKNHFLTWDVTIGIKF